MESPWKTTHFDKAETRRQFYSEYLGEWHEPRVPTANYNMDSYLDTYTNYTSPRSQDDRTIWGRAETDLHYDYDDRIVQWDYDRHKAATAHADEEVPLTTHHRTAAWFQAYLRHFYDKPVVLRHIMAGCNRSNGFPYLVFGTRWPEEPRTEEATS
jgi:hypothetical protein